MKQLKKVALAPHHNVDVVEAILIAYLEYLFGTML